MRWTEILQTQHEKTIFIKPNVDIVQVIFSKEVQHTESFKNEGTWFKNFLSFICLSCKNIFFKNYF